MIGLLIFILIVLIICGILIYAVQMMPFITPPWIKQLIIVLILLVAVLIIAQKAGIAAEAQTPTPIQSKQRTIKPVSAPAQQPPSTRRMQFTNWQRFQGATQCTQEGNLLTCDNGYRQTLR